LANALSRNWTASATAVLNPEGALLTLASYTMFMWLFAEKSG